MKAKDAKKGMMVRIDDILRPDWDGKEGEISTLGVNGAVIRFPNGRGTAVKYSHLTEV